MFLRGAHGDVEPVRSDGAVNHVIPCCLQYLRHTVGSTPRYVAAAMAVAYREAAIEVRSTVSIAWLSTHCRRRASVRISSSSGNIVTWRSWPR